MPKLEWHRLNFWCTTSHFWGVSFDLAGKFSCCSAMNGRIDAIPSKIDLGSYGTPQNTSGYVLKFTMLLALPTSTFRIVLGRGQFQLLQKVRFHRGQRPKAWPAALCSRQLQGVARVMAWLCWRWLLFISPSCLFPPGEINSLFFFCGGSLGKSKFFLIDSLLMIGLI